MPNDVTAGRDVSATPMSLGFRMPAEWEPHEATWLSWPHKLESWPGAFEEVPSVFANIAYYIAESELVRINVRDAAIESEVRALLEIRGVRMESVRFHHNPTNDAWVRDHGPIYVVRDTSHGRERAITNWGYNAWGGKYPPYDLDDRIPTRIAAEFDELRFDPGMVLEGGSIDVNGQGTLLTTAGCLLHPNRNPDLSKSDIEARLRDYLGIRHFLWLGEGILGDDTDGHVDDLTRFVGPSTLVTMVEPDHDDPNHEPLAVNLDLLRTMRDESGTSLEVVEIPMPQPVYFGSERLPASYANFLITNAHVLVPVYGVANDGAALEILQSLFPGRDVVGIDCTRLAWGLGAIHCVTQQQPAGIIVRETGSWRFAQQDHN